MTTTTNTTLTKAQFEVAYRLAYSQGHTWATASGLQCTEESISIAEIRKNTESRNYRGRTDGLVSPYVDATCVVQHTGGKIEWSVYPNGAYILRVHRYPYDAVLEYQSETGMFPSELIINDHALERHAQVMIQCLKALEVSIPARLTDIKDVGSAEILRRLACLGYIPSDLADDLEDAWAKHTRVCYWRL